MYIERDEEFNLLYVAFKDRIAGGEVAKTEEVVPGVYIDLDSEGKLLGIEIVNTTEVLGIPVSDLHLSGELLGVKEAAELAGKDRANFLRDLVGKPDFPDPVARLASGQVWLSKDIERYLAQRRSSTDTHAAQMAQINEAAQEFTDALVQSFRAVADRTVGAQEQGTQLTREFFNRVIDSLYSQAVDARQVSQEEVAGQQQSPTEAGRPLTQESVATYMDFVNSMFSFWQSERTERETLKKGGE